MQKLFCYVDETGQDARSAIFLVSVVVVQQDRDTLIAELERIEKATGKGRRKWMDARDAQRVAYMEQVFSTPAFRGKLYFASYPKTTEYFSKTG